jgi:quinol-cytochrome oxidoreductase complex cytochrome b subunit
LLLADVVLLTYVGAMPAEGIWPTLGLIATVYYFAHFLILLPLLGKFERPKPVPESINKPVLPKVAPQGPQAQPAE